MRQANLPRPWHTSPTDQARIAYNIVWRAKGAQAREHRRRGLPSDAMNSKHLQQLVRIQGREKRRESLGQHTLATPWGSNHKEIVVSRCRDRQSSFRRALPKHII